MSVIAQAWAVQQRCGSPTLKAVLMAVAAFADDAGLAWPSQRRIADDTELEKRTVRNALRALEDKGLLRREAHIREDGSRASDRIQLSMEPAASGVLSEAPVGGEPRSGGGVGDTGDGEPRSAWVGNHVPGDGEPRSGHELPLELSENISSSIKVRSDRKPESRKPKPEPDGFPEWYEAFPRHVGRDDAAKAYAAVLRDGRVTQAELLAGARRYASEREGQDQTFTKWPASWLRAGRWADEPLRKLGRPAPTLVEAETGQKALVTRWKTSPDTWPAKMGPRPNEPGCRIPREILAACGVAA